MASFTPPVHEGEVPAFHAGTRGPALRLMRHHGGNPRGRNVYYLSDGTVTETDPDSRAVFWTRSEGSPYVVQTWWGSTASAYEVTAAQASALTTAGYTVS